MQNTQKTGAKFPPACGALGATADEPLAQKSRVSQLTRKPDDFDSALWPLTLELRTSFAVVLACWIPSQRDPFGKITGRCAAEYLGEVT
jgi:hypothetical protein